jgi:quercetin dioxygenase-like cupin family protein
MSNLPLIVVNAKEAPWEERPNERIGRPLFRKELFEEPETGMTVRLVRYPAGVINPRHTHPCGHGMYVLEGRLVTHEGTYEPGTFVWFPEGQVMEHGASPDGDAVVLFVTNKKFWINYVD